MTISVYNDRSLILMLCKLIFNIDLEHDETDEESDDIDSGMYISAASPVVTPILIFSIWLQS